MRDIRRMRDKFEFSLDARQISLLFFVSIIILGLVFTIGVMFGRGLKKVESPQIAVLPDEEKKIPKGLEEESEKEPAVPSPGTEYTFYETLPKEAPAPGLEPGALKEVKPPVVIGAPEAVKEEEPVQAKEEKTISKEEIKTSAKGEPASPQGEYAVQVIAYTDRDKGREMVKKLKNMGYNAFIEQGESRGKKIFRVKAGYFATREEAEKVAKEIQRKEKLSAFVTK